MFLFQNPFKSIRVFLLPLPASLVCPIPVPPPSLNPSPDHSKNLTCEVVVWDHLKIGCGSKRKP